MFITTRDNNINMLSTDARRKRLMAFTFNFMLDASLHYCVQQAGYRELTCDPNSPDIFLQISFLTKSSPRFNLKQEIVNA